MESAQASLGIWIKDDASRTKIIILHKAPVPDRCMALFGTPWLPLSDNCRPVRWITRIGKITLFFAHQAYALYGILIGKHQEEGSFVVVDQHI